jgi:hypothetical protein
MEATEYFAFLPLLIYGIALADLFSQWKRLFSPICLPHLISCMISMKIWPLK